MLSGYNDKQPLYLEYILNKLITLPLKQDKFDLQMEIVRGLFQFSIDIHYQLDFYLPISYNFE